MTSAAAIVGGLALCVAIFGFAFLENLLTPRAYSFGHLVSQIGHLQWVALALVIWAGWAWSDRGSYAARFTGLLIGWGLFSCLLQWLGSGVFGNAQFDLNFASAIGVGVALAKIDTSWLGRRIGAGPSRDVVVILLVLRLIASERQESAQVLFSDRFRSEKIAATLAQADFAARIMATPGAVMCWKTNLVCRQAGKEFIVDDFKTDQLVATGQFSEDEVFQMLQDRQITILREP